jgi:sec-independent protein translocase protein TatA
MGRFEEFLVIFGVGLLLFGPNKLKDVAASLGGALNEFKKAMNPESQNAQPATASAQPVAVQAVAHTPVRRRKATAAKKKAKSSR